MDRLAALDATAQAELVRSKELSPLELVDAAIARIERLNPRLNAVILPLYEEARRRAQGPLPEGPFRGVPFLLKDLLAARAGVRMASGSRYLEQFVPRVDSELVRRLEAAGLVFLGKTNVPEFGILPTTESRLFGACKNPWDLSRSTGGSSGGAAAAVAAGLVPFAHASDGGGSIRIPASCCGLFGLKPARGRNPLGPDIGDVAHGLVVEHALTRSVRDSAALLDATEGMDVGAPYAAPPKARPYVQEVGARVERLRVRFTTEVPTGGTVDPECARAVREAAALLESLGHQVEEGTLADVEGVELVTPAFLAVWAGAVVLPIDGYAMTAGLEPHPGLFEPLTWAMYEQGRATPLSHYLMGVAILQRFSRVFLQRFVDTDVWLSPVLTEPPVPLGTFLEPPDDPMAALMRAAQYVPFTPIANITGQPAMSVPLHWTDGGLPVGVQVLGRFGDEGLLFRLAAQLEAARPWAERRPPVFAG